MSFKYHITNHFKNCRLLAKTYDVYRQREVSVFMIPGTFDHVGVCDTTDAWVAPVAADPFQVNIREILGKIQSGEDPAVVTRSPTGRLVTHQPEVQEIPKSRRRLAEEPSPPRRRILNADYAALEQRAIAATTTPQRRRLPA